MLENGRFKKKNKTKEAHGWLKNEEDCGFLELFKIVYIVLNLFYLSSSKIGPN